MLLLILLIGIGVGSATSQEGARSFNKTIISIQRQLQGKQRVATGDVVPHRNARV